MPRTFSKIIGLLLLMLLAGAVVWWWAASKNYSTGQFPSQIADETVARNAQPVQSMSKMGRGAQGVASSHRRMSVEGLDELWFVDARTRDPVPHVLLLPSHHDRSMIEIDEAAAVAKADSVGHLTLDDVEKGLESLVAFAPGYRIRTLEGVARGVTTMALQPSVVTRVYCRSQGRPVRGCRVVVSRRQRFSPPRLDATGVARPGAARPLWSATTDSSGMAILQGIEPGRYRLHVFSAQWFSNQPRFQGQRDLDLPIERIDVPLIPMLGAVFTLPPGVGPGVHMLGYQASWESGFSRPTISVRRFSKAYLQERFGDALVIFTRGALSAAQALGSVQVEMLLSNGARCTGVADMVPLEKVHPKALTVVRIRPLREIRIQVKDNEGVRLHLGLGSGRMVIPIVSGVVSAVPCGDYDFVTPRYIGPGHHRWSPQHVVVPEGRGVFPIALDVGGPSRMLRIVPKLSDLDCHEPVWLQVEHSNGDSTTLTPLALKDGQMEMLLPYGQVKLSAGTIGFGSTSRKLVIGKNTPDSVKLLIPRE